MLDIKKAKEGPWYRCGKKRCRIFTIGDGEKSEATM
jgi:hypothetical protein